MRHIIKPVVLTSITSLMSILSLLITTKLITQNLGEEAFGLYGLFKRYSFLLLPFASLATSITITKAIALSRNEQERIQYFFSSILLILLTSCIFFVGIYLFGSNIQSFFFSEHSNQNVIYYLAIFVVSFVCFELLYGFERGRLNFVNSNILHLIFNTATPLLIIVTLIYLQQDIVTILKALSIASLFILCLLLVYLLKFIGKYKLTFSLVSLLPKTRELANHGLQRIPGSMAINLLFTSGPFLINHLYGLKSAGFYIIGLYGLKFVDVLFSGFGAVILPQAATLLRDKERPQLTNHLNHLLFVALCLGLFFTVQLLIWLDILLGLWLGKISQELLTICSSLAIAVLPYTFYVATRQILEVHARFSTNTINLLVSLTLSLICVGTLALFKQLDKSTIIYSNLTAFFTLSILSIYACNKHYAATFSKRFITNALFINLICFIVTVGLKLILFSNGSDDGVLSLVKIGIISSINAAILYLCIKKSVNG